MLKVLPNIKVVDVWPEGTLSQSKMLAYLNLQKNGQIKINDIIYTKKTRTTTFSYLSISPEEWIHERLKDVSEQWQINVNSSTSEK